MSDTLTFTPEGILPPGDYSMTLDQLRASILVLGPGDPKHHPDWDAAWRLQLVDNLETLVKQLWAVGIDEIYVDGSFAEDKDHPNDIDGYFVCDEQRVRTRSLHRDLNKIDPAKCWTWNHAARRPYRGYTKRQLPMWHEYRVELYPHWPGWLPDGTRLGMSWSFRHGSAVSETTVNPRASSKLSARPAAQR